MKSSNGGLNQTPVWAWGLGMLPWVWIIPLNQYFWDDWLWSHNTEFTWHLEYWLFDGAKHFVDPFIYPTLIGLGAWSFGVLTSLATFATAWTISKIVETQTWVPSIAKKWIGPFILVLPVFHSRFSAATLEYSLSLAALFIAWWVTVSRSYVGRFLVSVPLLVFAIGVPSLTVLFPLLYLHVVLGECSLTSSRYFFRTWVKNSYIVIIPGLFAIVFSTYFNREGKYEASFGATVEFFRGLIILLIAAALILAALMRSKRPHSRDSILVVSSGIAAYLGFFPYFAVGYNPLSDYLPWRMRPNVMDGIFGRLATTLCLLLLIGICAFLRAGAHGLGLWQLRVATVFFGSIFFAAVLIVFGPMDWESRHWLVAWPILAFFFISLIAILDTDLQQAIAKSVFLVFLAASLWISGEYLVDSMKQKALVTAAENELRGSAHDLTSGGEEIVVVLKPTSTMSQLNARFRTYRVYEWWGLLAKGMAIQPSQLRVLEQAEDVVIDTRECRKQLNVIGISPEVFTDRLQALTTFRVSVRLNPEPLVLCSDVAREN